MYITCPCQQCGDNIEFDSNDFARSGETSEAILGQLIKCPHCEKDTVLYIPNKIIGATSKIQTAPSRRVVWLLASVVLLGLIYLAQDRYGFGNLLSGVGITAGFALYAALAILSILLVGFWILFPILMYLQLKEANRRLQQIELNTRQQRQPFAPVN